MKRMNKGTTMNIAEIPPAKTTSEALFLDIEAAVSAGFPYGAALTLPDTVPVLKPHRFIRNRYSDNHRRHDLLGYIYKTFIGSIRGVGPFDIPKSLKADTRTSLVIKEMAAAIGTFFVELDEYDMQFPLIVTREFNDNKKTSKKDLAFVWNLTMRSIGYDDELTEDF